MPIYWKVELKKILNKIEKGNDFSAKFYLVTKYDAVATLYSNI